MPSVETSHTNTNDAFVPLDIYSPLQFMIVIEFFPCLPCGGTVGLIVTLNTSVPYVCKSMSCHCVKNVLGQKLFTL